MVFYSLEFFFFLPLVFLIHYYSGDRARRLVLLLASICFYAAFKLPHLLAALALVVIVTYAVGLRIGPDSERGSRKAFFLFGICANLLVLVAIKYLPVIINGINALTSLFPGGMPLPARPVLVSIGVSYFVFQAISYLIDVYLEIQEPERDFGEFALYLSFFPKLLQGPIERASDLLPQLHAPYEFRYDVVRSGLFLFTWGMFKKLVVADRLSQYVNVVFDQPQNHADLSLLFGLIFYSFQIYCDFSGYSDMAIGLARILCIETMENFHFPYFSRSISEFWSRWHISLSSWLRDYLFLPISYALSRKIKPDRFLFMKTELFIYGLGMSVTMLLCGLWHGANWTFVVWGGLHGFYMIFSRATNKGRSRLARRLRLRRSGRLWSLFRSVFVFGLVTLAWVFFRSPSLASAWSYLSSISFKLPRRGVGALLFMAGLVAVFILFEALQKNRQALWGERRIPVPVQAVALAFCLSLLILLAADTSNEFLYFQF